MATIFITRARGQVARVQGPWRSVVPFTIRIPGVFGTGGTQQRMFVTRGGIDANDSVQLQETLGDDVFAYIFGASIGDVTIGGYAFCPCDDSRHGILDLFEAYNKNRIAVTGKPTYIDFGGRAFPAILMGLNAEVADPVSVVAQFSLKLKALPK